MAIVQHPREEGTGEPEWCHHINLDYAFNLRLSQLSNPLAAIPDPSIIDQDGRVDGLRRKNMMLTKRIYQTFLSSSSFN